MAFDKEVERDAKELAKNYFEKSLSRYRGYDGKEYIHIDSIIEQLIKEGGETKTVTITAAKYILQKAYCDTQLDTFKKQVERNMYKKLKDI